jgi:hypothetical protein
LLSTGTVPRKVAVHFLLALGRFNEQHVRTGFMVSSPAPQRFFQAFRGSCVSAGDDYEVGIVPRIDRWVAVTLK